MKPISKLMCLLSALICSGWGFFSHQQINRQAVFLLPPEMIGFYKANIVYLTEAAVNPDRRRYAVKGEAPRHFIDLDVYGDSAVFKLPHRWKDAVQLIGEDSLMKHGIVPWHIDRAYGQLRDAMLVGDPERILKCSAELGHYVGDAHVPLHTTANYDGQQTAQNGLHGFWESRLPELYFDQYNLMQGRAQYIANVREAAWRAIAASHKAVDSVLRLERELFEKEGHHKYTFEAKGRQTLRVVSVLYAAQYHKLLAGMVERRLRASIRMTSSLWYSAWIDGGQPDLERLIHFRPTTESIMKKKEELKRWKQKKFEVRDEGGEK